MGTLRRNIVSNCEVLNDSTSAKHGNICNILCNTRKNTTPEGFRRQQGSTLRSCRVFVKVIYTHFMYEFLMMLTERFDACLHIRQPPDGWCIIDEVLVIESNQQETEKP